MIRLARLASKIMVNCNGCLLRNGKSTTCIYLPVRKYSAQVSLPKLQVPPLKQTLEKYLRTIRPLVNKKEYEHNQNLATTFLSEGGPKLQNLLVEHAKNKENWLNDWWLDHAYLLLRPSVVINSNPAVVFKRKTFRGVAEQVQYAAKMVAGVLDFKKQLDSFSVPIEYSGKNPLCMSQFYTFLNSCRVPGSNIDQFVHVGHGSKTSKHITVLHNNHIFEMEVYGKDGKPLKFEQITDGLHTVIDESKEVAPPVGILTSVNRSSWGNTYENMIKDEQNFQAMQSIQKSIFVLCLDQAIDRANFGDDIDSGIAIQLLTGGGSCHNSGNRWFDKTMQVVVGEDGVVGANCEHSPAEANVVTAIADHAVEFVEKGVFKGSAIGGDVQKPKKLVFNLNKDVLEVIEHAKDNIDIAVKDLDVTVRDFTGFGKDVAKSVKLSPDAFIQVAMQLAYYRLHGKVTAGYESAMTRKFHLGRTETIRSCSVESAEFCHQMDSTIPESNKEQLMRSAIASHSRYTVECMTGNGVDRHFLGLKLMALQNGMKIPEIILDPAFAESVRFRISSSQVASEQDAVVCFGAMYHDGYGFCYNPQPKKLLYTVTAFHSNSQTNSQQLANMLEQSLLDMQLLGSCRSKL